MVQPQPDGPMQWDMSGDESGGVLRVPPELAANEVVTRLLNDNQQLRGKVEELGLSGGQEAGGVHLLPLPSCRDVEEEQPGVASAL